MSPRGSKARPRRIQPGWDLDSTTLSTADENLVDQRAGEPSPPRLPPGHDLEGELEQVEEDTGNLGGLKARIKAQLQGKLKLGLKSAKVTAFKMDTADGKQEEEQEPGPPALPPGADPQERSKSRAARPQTSRRVSLTASQAQRKERPESEGRERDESPLSSHKGWTSKQRLQEKASPIKYELVGWSSQRNSGRQAASNLVDKKYGTMWETSAPPEHWLVLDLGSERQVCGVKLRCTGTATDPQNVTIMRCSSQPVKASKHLRSQEGPVSHFPEGPWVMVRRTTLESGLKGTGSELPRLTFPPERARYLRIIFHNTWNNSGLLRLLAPLTVYALPTDPALVRQPSLTTMFSELVTLGEEERDMRQIARRNNIPLLNAESVRNEFQRFDSEGKGTLGYQDFAHVVRTMTKGRPGETKKQEIPESRIRGLWQTVDSDGSGRVEFEEFLVWFHRNFNGGPEETVKSFHSEKKADSAVERFYNSLGRNRFHCFLKSRSTQPEE